MRKFTVLLFILLLHITVFSQNENDSLKSISSNRKLNGFITLLSDFTINEHQQFAMTGMGCAFLFNDRFFIGGYGIGLVSSLHRSGILTADLLNNYQLNYAHGGLWLGIIDSPYKKIHGIFSIKLGYGALFMHNVNTTIDYNINRDEFFVITPQIESVLLLTDWLRVNLGLGVCFLSGISIQYQAANGEKIFIYNSSDFEGFVASISFNFGSFYNKSSH